MVTSPPSKRERRSVYECSHIASDWIEEKSAIFGRWVGWLLSVGIQTWSSQAATGQFLSVSAPSSSCGSVSRSAMVKDRKVNTQHDGECKMTQGAWKFHVPWQRKYFLPYPLA